MNEKNAITIAKDRGKIWNLQKRLCPYLTKLLEKGPDSMDFYDGVTDSVIGEIIYSKNSDNRQDFILGAIYGQS